MINQINVETPVGAVIAFAGSVSEQEAVTSLEARGWLPCDGRPLAVNLYPELFAALGVSYGGGADVFHLPAIPPQKFGGGEVTYIIKFVRAAGLQENA